MRILLLLIVATCVAAQPCLGGSSGDEDVAKQAVAEYRKAMREGRLAERKKDWRGALAAYEKALKAKPGDRTAKRALEKARKEVGILPPGFEKTFHIPETDKDPRGNPIVTRKGKKADPKTGYAYEVWMTLPQNAVQAEGNEKQRDVMEFVLILPGTFMMGAPKSEGGAYAYEKPSHRVKITKPFYLGKYEVTQSQWEGRVMKNPCRFKKAGPDAPVEKVSWDECNDFLKDLDLTLPTEAQWEYACRAGMDTPFSFGRSLSVDQPNYHGDYPYGGAPRGVNRKTTIRVGSFKPNAWGLYDMHGNVWEWCLDKFSRTFYSTPEAGKPDPLCDSGGKLRSVRGGSWVGYASYCRSASRDGHKPDTYAGYIGFRAAKAIEGTK
ncbi:MAG: SUMF1/EgtB/PvdO family nonheme iron enzyme [Planctomycetota bacterium]|jgi:formylglycine-generating enzyme required for sulfatase activity